MSIQRIVCFKFKEGLDEASIRRHMQDFAGMKESISQIKEYRGGLTKPGDFNAPPDFDSMHYLVFSRIEDIDIYYHHPSHQSFIQNNQTSWQNVLVLNSDIEGNAV
jgi:hypothetical protein